MPPISQQLLFTSAPTSLGYSLGKGYIPLISISNPPQSRCYFSALQVPTLHSLNHLHPPYYSHHNTSIHQSHYTHYCGPIYILLSQPSDISHHIATQQLLSDILHVCVIGVQTDSLRSSVCVDLINTTRYARGVYFNPPRFSNTLFASLIFVATYGLPPLSG